jgi:hypothetical protein
LQGNFAEDSIVIQGGVIMSDEEHLIENLICYVQSVGWANVPKQHAKFNKPFYDLYDRYSKNGQTQVTPGTFKWLLNMAVYVVYHATVYETDFSEDEKCQS